MNKLNHLDANSNADSAYHDSTTTTTTLAPQSLTATPMPIMIERNFGGYPFTHQPIMLSLMKVNYVL